MDPKVEALRESVFEVEQAQRFQGRQIARRIFARTILGLVVFVVVVQLISLFR